jgi:hypothetical protein
MYPTRGETLIIRAPWVHHGMTYFYNNSDISYIIPRQSGDVILGGTFQVDDWCDFFAPTLTASQSRLSGIPPLVQKP